MKKQPESDRAFLRNIHAQYYAKKKQRMLRKHEEEKQLWLFDSVEEKKT